jgi:riboflavin synthase
MNEELQRHHLARARTDTLSVALDKLRKRRQQSKELRETAYEIQEIARAALRRMREIQQRLRGKTTHTVSRE